MMRLNLLLRFNNLTVTIQNNNRLIFVQTQTPRRLFSTKKNSSSSESSSSSSSSDDEQKTNLRTDKKKSAEARDKLNFLLERIIQEDAAPNKHPKLELAKPKSQKKKAAEDIRAEAGTESVKKEPIEQKIVKAVKDVAQSVAGDAKQTESELLQKLLSAEERPPTTSNLSDIVKDMTIDRDTKAPEQLSRGQQIQHLLQLAKLTKKDGSVPQRKTKSHSKIMKYEPIKHEKAALFRDEKLGIFPSKEVVDKWEDRKFNETWNRLHERELRLAVTHPPANYFQQMILWTEQGKLWKFPIDNEQGLDEEKKVYFTEHVFLEKHLEPWCPSKGPIRHFMELVCVGLSKNHYLTVQQKKDHIEWFKDYFVEKKNILHEVGAIPPGFDFSKEETKKIES